MCLGKPVLQDILRERLGTQHTNQCRKWDLLVCGEYVCTRLRSQHENTNVDTSRTFDALELHSPAFLQVVYFLLYCIDTLLVLGSSLEQSWSTKHEQKYKRGIRFDQLKTYPMVSMPYLGTSQSNLLLAVLYQILIVDALQPTRKIRLQQ